MAFFFCLMLIVNNDGVHCRHQAANAENCKLKHLFSQETRTSRVLLQILFIKKSKKIIIIQNFYRLA